MRKLAEYQKEAARFMIKHPFSGLFADPGTRKTSTTLAVFHFLKKRGYVKRMWVIAPKKVIQNVWPQEVKLWDTFKYMKVEALHGPKKDKLLATTDADILTLTCDGVSWLLKHAEAIGPLDMLVVDESTKFKNWSAYRSKALRKLVPKFQRRHILTGTPIPEKYIDIFGQMYIVDRGASLGRRITDFRNDFFYDAARKQNYSIWIPRRGATEKIDELVKPRVHRVENSVLTELPEMVQVPVWLDLPSDYKAEREAAPNAASKHFLERQLASGIMCTGEVVHTVKVEALADLLDELSGQHLITFFNYHAEGDCLSAKFKAPIVDGRTKDREATRLLEAWNAGEIEHLLINPAGASHGLNLQSGGHHICWFSLTDTGDVHEQANKRLHRSGQTNRVFIHYLLAKNFCDADMLNSLKRKSETQAKFLEAMRQP